ncbi:MAG: TonB-dependent receptor [Gemmatimonadetes bacterium]|nr:TonB-dependent receptor [Gemmatimonadota bacterium]
MLLAMVAGAPKAAAQAPAGGVTVSGRVQDAASREPLPFLAVQLLRARDSSVVAGRLTTATGAFTFAGVAKGSYLLQLRAIGYAPLRQRVLVGELSAYLDVGTLAMRREAVALGGVAVTADRTAAPDAQVVTVADNVSQAGGSALQAMSTLPGVTVGEDGKVLVRGSDKVLVLIDGQPTALTGAGTQRGLENLPASAIARIELVNNPSARYDANASAGIINLVLKKEERDGAGGRVGLVGGAGALWERRANLPTVGPQYRLTPKANPSLAVNRRRGGTVLYARADWLHSPTLNRNDFATRRYDDGTTIFQQLRRNRRTDYGTLAGGVDHALDERNTLALSWLLNREKILDHGDNPYFTGSLANRTRMWQFLEDEVKYTAYGTGAFTHRFPQPGHTLALTATYSFHREDEKYFFTNTLPRSTGTDAFALLSDEHVTEAAADYVKPLRQGRLEAGVKGRYRSIPVDMRFRPGANSVIDAGAGGWATYREVIPAVYGTWVREGDRTELEGGVRVEQVRVAYDVNPDHNTYRSDGYRYFQPFPSVRAAYKLDDRRKLTLVANRRVDRPNEVDIRIFPKYDEPELIKVGNPALQPQFTTGAELGYRAALASGSVSAALFHRVVDGTITRIATQAPGSVLLYHVFQNAGRSRSSGAEVAWQRVLSPQVTLGANATAYRQRFDAFAVLNRYPVPTTYTAARQTLTTGNAKVNAVVRWPRGWQSQVAAVALAPELLPQGRLGGRFGVDLGMKRSVQGGKGEWVANATDLFNTMRPERTLRGNGFTLVSTDFLETQVVRVGYSRAF